MNKNTKLKAFPTIPNKNICLPIGTTLAVKYFFEKLNFFALLLLISRKSKGSQSPRLCRVRNVNQAYKNTFFPVWILISDPPRAFPLDAR